MSAISRSMFQTFLNDLAENYAHETVTKIAGHCRACVSDALEDNIIRRNFTTRTNVPECNESNSGIDDNYLDLNDMTKLKKFIMPKISIYNISAAMIYTSLMSGARYSEIAGLTWNDVNYKDGTLRINKTLDYKGTGTFLPTKTKASSRVISLPHEVIKILGKLHQDQVAANIPNEHHLIFMGKLSHQVPSNNSVNKLLRNAHKNIGIKLITFHGLRHTHASYLIYKNVSIYVISERLGHSDVGITQRVYAHVIAELKQRQTHIITEALEQF